MHFSVKKFLALVFSLVFFIQALSHASAYYYLDCTSSTTLISKYRPVFYLSSTTNATIATASTTGYPVIVQCLYDDGRTDLATTVSDPTCSGNFTSGDSVSLFNVSHISGGTNLHAEARTLSNYGSSNTVCLSVFKTGLFSNSTSTLQSNNCNGYGTTLFSAPNTFQTVGNSHIGDANAYPLKFCLTSTFQQGISVSFNTNNVGFGTLSPSQIIYATGDGSGTTTATSSFAVDVSVVGNTGYSVYLSGDTLRNTSDTNTTIPGVGSSPTALVIGTDGFGIQATTSCLSSPCSIAPPSIQSPYNTLLYGFNLSTTTQTLIATGNANDSTNTAVKGGSRFLFTLGATASSNLSAGTYTSNLTLIVTPTF